VQVQYDELWRVAKKIVYDKLPFFTCVKTVKSYQERGIFGAGIELKSPQYRCLWHAVTQEKFDRTRPLDDAESDCSISQAMKNNDP
jgi:hypothetical protein